MKQIRAGVLAALATGLLTSCLPFARQSPQRFSAATATQNGRVVVTVTNLGPEVLWLGQNACAQDGGFKVGTLEPLPSPDPVDCEDFGLLPRSWPVGQSFTAKLPHVRLPPGAYTLKLWADLDLAPHGPERPLSFQTVRVLVPPSTVTVP